MGRYSLAGGPARGFARSISNKFRMIPLPAVNPAQIPEIWRRKAPPPSNGKPVKVYRGFARNVQRHAAAVIRSDEIGGMLSRDPAAASDAFFNQYGRDPVIRELTRAAWSRSPFQRTYGMNCSELPAFPNGKVILVFQGGSAPPRSALIRPRRLPPSTNAQHVLCRRNRGTIFVADGRDAPSRQTCA